MDAIVLRVSELKRLAGELGRFEITSSQDRHGVSEPLRTCGYGRASGNQSGH